MACPAQSMLSASSCVLLRSSKPQQATIPRGGINGNSRFLTVSCNASSSPDDSECNDVECAPEKEIGSLSVEWLAEERTKVVGTFPPKKKGWTGLVEKDTAGQTNIYSILIQVSKNQPPVQTTEYSGPPLSYYVAKFQPAAAAFSVQSSPPVVEAPAPEEAPSDSPTLEAESSATAEQPSS
uniref:Predicted protein n=1 Tax=Hordeum vulgare subsp. vulgare TaxID=112509 RepID=F2E125_HORVV|nr:predicted protein [Hordeum vulgare subsp. vulgare]